MAAKQVEALKRAFPFNLTILNKCNKYIYKKTQFFTFRSQYLYFFLKKCQPDAILYMNIWGVTKLSRHFTLKFIFTGKKKGSLLDNKLYELSLGLNSERMYHHGWRRSGGF